MCLQNSAQQRPQVLSRPHAVTVAGSVFCGCSAGAARRVILVRKPLAVWIVAPVAMPTSSGPPTNLKSKRLRDRGSHASVSASCDPCSLAGLQAVGQAAAHVPHCHGGADPSAAVGSKHNSNRVVQTERAAIEEHVQGNAAQAIENGSQIGRGRALEQHGEDDGRLHQRKLVTDALALAAAKGDECKVGGHLVGVQRAALRLRPVTRHVDQISE